MNEATEAVLGELLQRVLDGTDTVIEFGSDQVPEVIRQLLLWDFFFSLMFFVIGVGFLCLGLRLIKTSTKSIEFLRGEFAAKEEWTRFGSSEHLSSTAYDAAMARHHITPWLCLSAGSIFLLSNMAWLKISIAPKLYLIEYAASFVK